MNARLGAGLLVALALPCSILQAQTGGTCEPVAQRGDRVLGCYITARQSLGRLPADAVLYWHIDSFPTLAAAEAARSGRATAVSSLGAAWLFTLADSAWHVHGGTSGRRHRAGSRGRGRQPRCCLHGGCFRARNENGGASACGSRGVVHPGRSAMPRDAAGQAGAAGGRAWHDGPRWGADDAGRHRHHRAALAGADPPGREPAAVDTGNGLGSRRPVPALTAGAGQPATARVCNPAP